jgi:hypothetical protein
MNTLGLGGLNVRDASPQSDMLTFATKSRNASRPLPAAQGDTALARNQSAPLQQPNLTPPYTPDQIGSEANDRKFEQLLIDAYNQGHAKGFDEGQRQMSLEKYTEG